MTTKPILSKTLLGVPAILQSDNGQEFRNQLINGLKDLWPDMKIIHGRATHSQSQGSTERANAGIKKFNMKNNRH